MLMPMVIVEGMAWQHIDTTYIGLKALSFPNNNESGELYWKIRNKKQIRTNAHTFLDIFWIKPDHPIFEENGCPLSATVEMTANVYLKRQNALKHFRHCVVSRTDVIRAKTRLYTANKRNMIIRVIVCSFMMTL